MNDLATWWTVIDWTELWTGNHFWGSMLITLVAYLVLPAVPKCVVSIRDKIKGKPEPKRESGYARRLRERAGEPLPRFEPIDAATAAEAMGEFSRLTLTGARDGIEAMGKAMRAAAVPLDQFAKGVAGMLKSAGSGPPPYEPDLALPPPPKGGSGEKGPARDLSVRLTADTSNFKREMAKLTSGDVMVLPEGVSFAPMPPPPKGPEPVIFETNQEYALEELEQMGELLNRAYRKSGRECLILPPGMTIKLNPPPPAKPDKMEFML